jgi:hypothetical protein
MAIGAFIGVATGVFTGAATEVATGAAIPKSGWPAAILLPPWTTPSYTGLPNHSPLSTRNSSLMQQLELSEENQMQHKFLGNTGLKVSNMCLGTMAFGTFPGGPSANTNEATSHKLLNKFVELGGNFIDTADTYPGMGTHSGYSWAYGEGWPCTP